MARKAGFAALFLTMGAAAPAAASVPQPPQADEISYRLEDWSLRCAYLDYPFAAGCEAWREVGDGYVGISASRGRAKFMLQRNCSGGRQTVVERPITLTPEGWWRAADEIMEVSRQAAPPCDLVPVGSDIAKRAVEIGRLLTHFRGK